VGDNGAQRAELRLHIVTEPELLDGRLPEGASATPLRTLRVRFPDGPADCESVAIDPIAGRIWLCSKRTSPPRLYSVPIAPEDPRALLTAEPLADLPFTNRTLVEKGMQAPTAMDLSPDTRVLAVLSYATTYVWRRGADQSWAEALRATPTAVTLSAPQAEALCFSADAATLLVTGEKRHAVIMSAPLPAEAATPAE
jgi:hypothetical protein